MSFPIVAMLQPSDAQRATAKKVQALVEADDFERLRQVPVSVLILAARMCLDEADESLTPERRNRLRRLAQRTLRIAYHFAEGGE